MNGLSARLKAAVFLAWSLIVTLLRRLFGSKENLGIALFKENYGPDRLPPVTPEERANFGEFGGCIACGVCDRGEADRIAESRGEYRGVMHLMLGGSRSMPDYTAAALSFRHVPDEVLAKKETQCPTRVPMRAIARFVREKAAEEQRLAGESTAEQPAE